MKTLIKIEIIVLVIVILAAAAMMLISAGALMWIKEPIALQRQIVPVATEEAPAPAAELPESISDGAMEAQEPVSLPHSREITAENYFVYDVRDGVYLQQKGDLREKIYPASITKILSVYVVLQYMDPDQTVVVGDALELVDPDSSVAGLQEGDTLTVSQLISGMMLPSGNDAAQTAAVETGRVIAGDPSLAPSEAAKVFVDEMNKQAVAIGMTGSHFVNADGFHHEDHYTTMADLNTLAAKVLADPEFVSYSSKVQEEAELQDRTVEWKNTNYLLHPQYDNHISATIGLKTGFTDAAGSCLMSAFFMEDRLLIIGVFGCPAYTEDRYLDTAELFNTTII